MGAKRAGVINLKKLYACILSVCFLLLAACGNPSIDESITLQNQTGEEVTFPSDKPVVFFFMTTYT
ncbi:hypothetical protein [Bacillus sp. AK128]